ncbi:MAG TPA: hypothetical protein VGT81_07675 [Casimicrobiaceae bacterium]|nr:hypothetical protein [Casimicrobiaceae bacterium]
MKQSVLVPMLVAMFGAEAVAQMPAPPDDSRALGVMVAAKSAAAVIQEQPAYAASFVSQSAPATIAFQTPTPIVVTMRNTGTATWVKSEGDVFLATQEPQDNYYWCIQDNRYGSRSGNRVLLPYDVAPDQQVTFNFIVKPLSCFFAAPSPLRFRMLSPTHGTFGEETPDPRVTVTTAAEFVSQQVPATMDAGTSVVVSVTFKNTTSVTWTSADGYSLVSVGPLGNTTWGVSTVALPGSVAPGASVTFSFSVVAPMTLASYNSQWQMNLQASGPFGLASPSTAVQVVAAGPPNFGGLWWNAPAGSESGWGINLAHQGDVIVATWFTYDLTGKGWWLIMAAPKTAANTYSGPLLKSTGPAFDAVPFNPAQVVATGVGTGTLTFTDTNNGTFAYTVNGVSQTKNITHEVFGPLPTCRFGALSDLTLATNYQDLWWNSPPESESGWGINLAQQGTRIFATWFTYDHDHTPMWLVATMLNTAPATYIGTLYRTTGPAFNAVPFNPAGIVATSVGTATLTFADGNTATFSYTVNGVPQTKPITREVFVPPGTVCQ